MSRFVFCVLVFALITSCATTSKIDALKPEPDDAAPLVFEQVHSYINLPLSIKLKDIETQTNKFTNGLIYEDATIQDDQLEVRVWKQAPIKIEQEKGQIKTTLPLKVQVKYRIGTNKLGFDLYTTQEFNLNGTIVLLSQVTVSNWKLSTQTTLQSLTWAESPSINVLGKQVPITYIINPAIKLFKQKIEKTIDESIAKSVDLKPQVLDALGKIATPYLLNEPFQTWLRIIPLELYSTNSTLKEDYIALQLGLKCQIETVIGQKPPVKFDRAKITLKQVSKLDEKMSAHIVAISTYEDASEVITKNFTGQTFSSGKKQVIVKAVNLWHKSGKIVVALTLSGSINGTIYLSGYPQYNAQTQEIYFDQLAYVLDTKNKLYRAANWLAQGVILKKIEDACRYSIKNNLEEGKKAIMPYLKNYSPLPGVFVNGHVGQVTFEKIQASNKGIIAALKAEGTIKVDIDGL